MSIVRINPVCMDPTESKLLRKLLDKHRITKVVFEKDIAHEITVIDEQTGTSKQHYIILTNTLLQRFRNSNPQEYRYEVIDHRKLLGKGGFSKIYDVHCTLAPLNNDDLLKKKNKHRVVKIQMHKKKEIKFLFKEYRISKKAGHLHIKYPTLVKTETDEYKSYTVMRYLKGNNLFAIIEHMNSRSINLSTYQRLTICINALEKLLVLHNKKIIHQDIKPDNIMLDLDSGDLEIFDFGVSKYLGEEIDTTQGTPGYLSLEALDGLTTTEQSDVFSMAIVMGLIWHAEEPGITRNDMLNYAFPKIFEDPSIDLSAAEKTEVLMVLRMMNQQKPEERFSCANALEQFRQIRANYVERKKIKTPLQSNGVFAQDDHLDHAQRKVNLTEAQRLLS